MKRAVIALLVAATSLSLGLVRVVSVEPENAAWSGWTRTIPGQDYVSQSIVCNFDDLEGCFADYFTGTATSAQYKVEVRTPGENGVVVAHGQTYEYDDHVWVRCTLAVDRPDSIIKGRSYEVRWTLSGGTDSLMYYYSHGDPYRFGEMKLPGKPGDATHVFVLSLFVSSVGRPSGAAVCGG